MTQIDNTLYRAHVTVTAGRDARAVSSDGLLDLKVTLPA
jgi:osmotically inducible protein OsmC